MQTEHIESCAGGWCKLRDRCPHYHAGNEQRHPSERLCLPNRDGVSDVTSIKLPASYVPIGFEHGSNRIWLP